jgi:hypothetical protein
MEEGEGRGIAQGFIALIYLRRPPIQEEAFMAQAFWNSGGLLLRRMEDFTLKTLNLL